ncbi:permease for cytosine/purines, uracil, thiamine, allantoin-domain-containing protein [Neurospora hispaniola]|uniref:Permease for cytosine/purines, uracil, thiamine, allantoin-domain-containing protein n=1 Tax=Neurospora hispaniola TaxID=588809 RepID=A0AAJ0I1S0_9PEZI|nr:permease for cytosine/purines, uracil, thiamine, allantoin-domain-containing protein [Neurospora hispaniola]
MSTNNSTEDDEPKLPHGIVFQDIERTAGEEDDGQDKDQAETSTRFGSLCWPNFLSTIKEGDADDNRSKKGNPKWYQKLIDAGIEENGIQPVPLEGRTSTQYNQLFTVFFTGLLCLLPIPTGMLATLEFGLSLRDASLVIVFFALLTCLPPAFMGIGGMETGMRQFVQARYSFGLYLVIIPLLLNAATITGFTLMSAIAGGQTLAAINPSHVSINVGIVITCLVAFGISLLGFNFVHLWERWTWIPNLIALVITVGCGGRYLHLQSQPAAPATPAQILNLGSLMAGYFITFGGMVGDYSIYHNPRGVLSKSFSARARIFTYLYLGLFLPSVPLFILGAAIGGAVPQVPAWQAAYASTGIGGVMMEMLAPAGGFGKFVLVVLALSVIGNIAISMYTISLNLEMLMPPLPFKLRVHRFVFILVTMAVMIPMAVRAAKKWETSLINFLSIIGYWSACFDVVLILELVVFRRMDYATFDQAIWNVGRELPPGLAALGASMLSWALVVPGMAQSWYVGPIAKSTGDIGVEVAFVLTGLFYLPLRWLEIKIRGRF